jgi:YfiH family protein
MINQSIITFEILKTLQGFIHGFSTREMEGGMSSGPFHNFNLGNFQQDEKTHIEHNRILFFRQLHINSSCVAYPRQIHSAHVRLIVRPGTYPDCDALITRQKKVYLSIQTADCFPLFLIEPKAGIVALVHAGWRGVLNHIVEHTVGMMTEHMDADPAKILAAIGPGLQTECFEVKSDVYRFVPEDFHHPHPTNNKRYIDLAGFINKKLIALGLQTGNIEVSDLCTKCRPDLFFSFRRDGIKSGRMMGILGIC